MNAPFDISPCV